MTLHKLGTNVNLVAASGDVGAIASINKFGRNVAVASGTTEEIWDGSAAYVFPATALMTSISQTTDQTALRGETIEVQGLDANWVRVVQNADLGNPTTVVVTLTTPLIRVFRMRVLSSVVADSDIRCHNAVENQDYAIISTGNNQTLMAIYTIPADMVGYVVNYWANHNPTTGQTFTSNPIKLWMRDNANGYAPQLKHLMGLPVDTHWHHPFSPYLKVTEKTDVFITSSPVSGIADVSAGFDVIITND